MLRLPTLGLALALVAAAATSAAAQDVRTRTKKAAFDDVKRVDGSALEPIVTWGINPEMSVGVSQRIPAPESASEAERPTYREAWRDGSRSPMPLLH